MSVCPIFFFSSDSNASFQTLASDAGMALGALEEDVRGLGVPLETVERHAHVESRSRCGIPVLHLEPHL